MNKRDKEPQKGIRWTNATQKQAIKNTCILISLRKNSQ